MADLVITNVDNVSPVKYGANGFDRITAPRGAEGVTRGKLATLDSATGKLVLVDADGGVVGARGTRGIVISDEDPVAVTILCEGDVFLDDALDALDFGAAVYNSDTAGALSDTPPAENGEEIGRVVPIFDTGLGTPRKKLRVGA